MTDQFSEKVAIEATVNDVRLTTVVDARLSLADFIRENLGLTGTRLGCEQGVCGACTVLLDGKATRSCLVLAAEINGLTLTTIEGIDSLETGVDLPALFLQQRAFQCGFCTSGFLMLIGSLLLQGSDERLEESSLREHIASNLCRCTGYQPILNAAQAALEAKACAAERGR